MFAEWLETEIDLIEVSSGCAERCLHCSESPEAGVRHADVETLTNAVVRLSNLEKRLGRGLFAAFWYPFPASDPFAHPRLFELCEQIFSIRSLPSYLLSLGWNRGLGHENAVALAARPSSILRIAITISNFSHFASASPARHLARLAASLQDLRLLWDKVGQDGRPLVIISPQFVDGLADSNPLGQAAACELAFSAVAKAGLPESWLGPERFFPRPVVALGRAATSLGVTRKEEVQISAELPPPRISHFPERSLSGMINMNGQIELYEGARGLLGRERGFWRQASSILNATVVID